MNAQQFMHYYTATLAGQFRPSTNDQLRAECIFHTDNDHSLFINLRNGAWRCRCGSGTIQEFEMRRANYDDYDDYRDADRRIRQTIHTLEKVAIE